jgi:hypothetical protein
MPGHNGRGGCIHLRKMRKNYKKPKWLSNKNREYKTTLVLSASHLPKEEAALYDPFWSYSDPSDVARSDTLRKVISMAGGIISPDDNYFDIPVSADLSKIEQEIGAHLPTLCSILLAVERCDLTVDIVRFDKDGPVMRGLDTYEW